MQETIEIKRINKPIILLMFIVGSLSLFDGFATYWGLSNNHIEESNPIMRLLWDISPLVFLTFKTTVSILLITLGVLYQKTKQKVTLKIRFLTYLITAIYIFVTGVHILWISTL